MHGLARQQQQIGHQLHLDLAVVADRDELLPLHGAAAGDAATAGPQAFLWGHFWYTVGLTTLVEALALGMPIICSRNPYFEIDIDKEKVGISIPYGDVEGWTNAINYLETHPEEAAEMGRNARKLAEERFNLEIFSKEIAESLFEQAEK